MKRTTLCCFVFCVGMSSVYFGCGTKKKAADAIVIIHNDTLSVAELSRISPDTMATPKQIMQLALRYSLAKSFRQQVDSAGQQEIIADFTDELNRGSRTVWSETQAGNLYRAVKTLMENIAGLSTGNDIKRCVDSCAAGIIIPGDTAGTAVIAPDASVVYSDTTLAARNMQLAALCTSLLGTNARLSKSIAEFVYSEYYQQKDQSIMSDMIKGLVFDNTAIAKKTVSRAVKTIPDNSKLALKYRNQQSIQQTISQHTPILQGIYKKELKKNPLMEGVVYITFRVSPAGDVISAKIKSSYIDNMNFINPLLEYVRKIKFTPIPEDVGNMTFDFPFEFKPEM